MSPALLSRLASAPSVTTTLNYSRHDPSSNEPPFSYINDQPDGKPSSNLVPDPQEIQIRDLRGAESEIGLDVTGFQVVKSDSLAVFEDGRESRSEWDDEDWIKDVYYKESAE